MSEKLKNNNEILHPKSEVGELRAMKLLEELNEVKADQGSSEQTQKMQQEAYDLAVMAATEAGSEQKSVYDMTPTEVANEYLDLLQKLSQDFNKSAEKGRYRVSTIGMSELSSKEKRMLNDRFEVMSQEDASAVQFADAIISGESMWRSAKDQAQEDKRAQDELDDLEASHRNKPFLKQLLSYGAYKKEKQKIKNSHRRIIPIGLVSINDATQKVDRLISVNLYKAYGNYRYGGFYNDEHEQQNQSYNDKFFNAERMPDIDRAIELYRRLHATAYPAYQNQER